LPPKAVRERKKQIILQSPITIWFGGLLVAFVVLGTMTGLPLFAIGITTLVGVAAMGSYWRRQLAKLERQIELNLVDESNEAQNQEFLRRIKSLQDRGYASFAKTLGNFVSVKASIEKELHSSGDLDESKARVEYLVDSLMADVANQYETLVALDQREKKILGLPANQHNPERLAEISTAKKNLGSQLERAYLALRDIGTSVADIVNPMPTSTQDLSSRLEDTISDMHAEAEIAERVSLRLAGDL